MSPRGAHFFQALLRGGGLRREGGLICGETHQREQGFSRTDLWFPGVILLFLTIKNGNNSAQRVKLTTSSTGRFSLVKLKKFLAHEVGGHVGEDQNNMNF